LQRNPFFPVIKVNKIEHKGFNIHQELIEQCRNGNRSAQEEIYRLYYKAMFNTCLRMLNDRVEAEDVMQDAFLAAFLKLGQYRGEMSFGSWLKRIVINKAIDAIRARKIRFEELNEGTEDEGAFVIEDAQTQEDAEQMAVRIKVAVQNLPEGFRVVLSLFLFEGYDHEEIAQILGINESTSRSQLARAKKKLAAYLKEGMK
jgi:RNA polymerase sigma factor (sigma-70 family)